MLSRANSFGCRPGQLMLSSLEADTLAGLLTQTAGWGAGPALVGPDGRVVAATLDSSVQNVAEDVDVGNPTSDNLVQADAFEKPLAVEAKDETLRRSVLHLYLSKETFAPERRLVQLRVFQKVAYCCRTYVLLADHLPRQRRFLTTFAKRLRPRSETGAASKRRISSSVPGVSRCLSAITVRINGYTDPSKAGARWAQVLNAASRTERKGYGGMLFREVERLLAAQQGVDVLICYPVDSAAANFWRSCGFAPVAPTTPQRGKRRRAVAELDDTDEAPQRSKKRGGAVIAGLGEQSLLKPGDLIPASRGGCLLPEVRGGTKTTLRRWEKAVVSQN